jgi:hypothetical protein
MNVYTFAANGDTLKIKANFAQAACPLMIGTADGGWTSTPFQVADARHCHRKAAVLVNNWLESQGGGLWAPGKTSGIKVTVRRA